MKFRLANPFVEYPARSLLGAALLGLPLLLLGRGWGIDSDARILLAGDRRNLETFEKVTAILQQEVVIVVSMEGENVFTRRGLEKLRDVSDALQQQPGALDAKSLTHSVKPVRRGFGFQMVPFVPDGPLSDEEIRHLREFSLTHPLVRNVMVSADARHLLITVTYRRDLSTPALRREFRAETEALLATFEDAEFRFRTLGIPFAEDEVYTTLKSDLARLAPVATVILLGLLWLAFRSARLLVLVLVNLALVLAFLPGLMRLAGVSLNLYTVTLFPLLGGLQLTLWTHVLLAFRHEWNRGHGSRAAVAGALRRVFKSCAFAALTTALALLSLGLSEVQPVREFGLVGAVAITFAFVWSFGPGLALLQLAYRARSSRSSRSGPPEGGTPNTPAETVGRLACALAEAVVRQRVRILSIAALTIPLLAIGVANLRTDVRVVEFLNPASPTRQMLEEFDRDFGGINLVQIEFDTGHPEGVNNLDFLRFLEQVQAFAERQPEVSGVYSYAQLLAMMNQVWESERPGSLRLPENPVLLNLFVLALKTQEYPFLTALAEPELQRAFLIVRTRDMPSNRYLKTLEEIVGYARNHSGRPAGVRIAATRGMHSILEADRRIVRSQASSLALTVGGVGLTLALLWRSAWLAALALITNLIPVGLGLAAAGFSGVSLNSVTVMLAALVLGIAIDDAVHFITWWRDEYRRGNSLVASLAATLQAKGPPILYTSLILIGLLLSFVVFSFPPVRQFGLLSALAFAAALGTMIFFLPAALAQWTGKQSL